MLKEKVFCTRKNAFMISLLTCLITAVFLLAFFVFFSSPGVIDKMSSFNLISVLSKNHECSHNECQVTNILPGGSELLSLKEVWGFQSSLYQTVITFLIAINGFIAALSVLYIKTNSEDKAEDAAKSYVKGDSFSVFIEKILSRKSRKKLRQLQQDYASTMETFDLEINGISDLKENVEALKNENSDLKRQLSIISKKLAELDEKEKEGGSFELNRRVR
ncbi:DUF5320 domain-containing protein [Vreelandella boliviensis]|uniref:DUF5320 domain-containing protein n=1 Tax=Vreelandella boliviensis TaxID=223527 RepID=UPI001B8B145F|nr:DUF5320 domain-containing protein [Halomonas boliviensis]MBS3669921.1 DUF5320 domain-containing protein [Halomonas boliviensis]